MGSAIAGQTRVKGEDWFQEEGVTPLQQPSWVWQLLAHRKVRSPWRCCVWGGGGVCTEKGRSPWHGLHPSPPPLSLRSIRSPSPHMRQEVFMSLICWYSGSLEEKLTTGLNLDLRTQKLYSVLTEGLGRSVIWYRDDHPVLTLLFGVLLTSVRSLLGKGKMPQIPSSWPALLLMLYWFQQLRS